MKTLNVTRGHSPRNPERHCSDGDSSYVTGSFENTLMRLANIDAFEIRGLSLYYLEKSGFLNKLKKQLREHLEPKLTQQSIQIHKELGHETWDYFESILEEELVVSFERETFDRHSRPLVHLSTRDNQDTYNLELVQTGYALPYFIYPNAVSATDEGKWTYDVIQNTRCCR